MAFLFVFVFVTCHVFDEVFALNVILAYDLLIRIFALNVIVGLTRLMRVFDLNVIVGLTRNPILLKNAILNQVQDDLLLK